MGALQRLIWRLPEEASARWTYEAEVDALIVGASLQGLCLLDTLSEAGFSAGLVAEEPIGAGPLEIWDGLFESGYGDPEPGLRRAVEDDWVPYLERRGISTDGEWYAIARGRTDERLRAGWEDADYPFDIATPDDLPPEWREGELFDGADQGVYAIEEYAVRKQALLAAFLADHGDRVVRGGIREYEVDADGKRSIEEVEIELVEGGRLEVQPDHLVVAAGGRTPDVLDAIASDCEGESETDSEGFTALDDVSFRDVHVLAIRAPRGALPEASAHLFPRDLTVTVRPEERGEAVGTVAWYVTSDSFPASEAADGRIDPSKAGTAFSELFSLVPAVRERAERENSGIEFGVFAGKRAELEDRYFVEPVEPVSNLTVALADPSTAWAGAHAVERALDGRLERGESKWLPTTIGAQDVRGPRAGTTWLDWEELIVRYPEADPIPDPTSTRR